MLPKNPKIKLLQFMLDCKEPHRLAEFYAALLGWKIVFETEAYAGVSMPDAVQGVSPCIAFQRNAAYLPPVWPEEPDAQQQMAHLDFAVTDLQEAVRHAVHCGAVPAEKQFSDSWTVMLDPAGHPFCLCLDDAAFAADETAPD